MYSSYSSGSQSGQYRPLTDFAEEVASALELQAPLVHALTTVLGNFFFLFAKIEEP